VEDDSRKFLKPLIVRRAVAFLIGIQIVLAIWILNVSRIGYKVEGCMEGCSIRSSPDDGILRVVSLNMLHGFPQFEYLDRRMQGFIDEITQLNPDIILLQEVPWTMKRGNSAKMLAERIGMNYAYLRANGSRWAIGFEEGVAVLSRYSLISPAFIELKPKSGFFEHRVVLHLIARTEIGEVGFYVTHLTHEDPFVNQGQVESLMGFVNPQPDLFSIVAGDFNALPASPQMTRINAVWVEPFEAQSSGFEQYTCCIRSLTQETKTLSKQIDYLWIVPGKSIPKIDSAAHVFNFPLSDQDGWIWVSDHVGLMVDIGEFQ
jgi:endonuclease/exonuclease/phosphatase family metal-dependent hydrolase